MIKILRSDPGEEQYTVILVNELRWTGESPERPTV